MDGVHQDEVHDIEFRFNDDSSLMCEKWPDGKHSNTNGMYTTLKNGTTCQLTIERATEKHTGKYNCRIKIHPQIHKEKCYLLSQTMVVTAQHDQDESPSPPCPTYPPSPYHSHKFPSGKSEIALLAITCILVVAICTIIISMIVRCIYYRIRRNPLPQEQPQGKNLITFDL